ncbi:MAG: uncharacterized protein JWO05_1047 [Gemmatimonadetes bacterium]|nr:uncharacterized protein [Gemmatimonadota bacterium]
MLLQRTRRTAYSNVLLFSAAAALGSSSLGAQSPVSVATASTQPLSNQERIAIRQAARKHSVLVQTQVTETTGKRGSGFVVWRSGVVAVVLTNDHVIQGEGGPARAITVQPFKGTPLLAYPLTGVQDKALGVDYAFLVVHDSTGSLGEAVEVVGAPEAGQRVIAVGNPLDEDFLIDEGVVKRTERTATGQAIYHSALIEHGSSGGGLFDTQGRLIGINTYITPEQDGIALAVQPLLTLIRFHSVVVNAKDDWQDSGVLLTPNSTVYLIATGKWKVSPFLAAFEAPGVAGLEKFSFDRRFAHGALLMRVGPNGEVDGVTRWWQNNSARAGILTLQAPPSTSSLRFRINDADLANNSGRITVTVLEWRAPPQ